MSNANLANDPFTGRKCLVMEMPSNMSPSDMQKEMQKWVFKAMDRDVKERKEQIVKDTAAAGTDSQKQSSK
jgi:hypothetical protein